MFLKDRSDFLTLLLNQRSKLSSLALWCSRTCRSRLSALAFGLALMLPVVGGNSAAIASPLPTSLPFLVTASAEVVLQPTSASNLDAAPPRIEAATDAIYEGLEQTQQEIGKTAARSDAIEYGRDHATAKLEGLLERAEEADSLDELPNTDRLTLKRLTQ